MTQPKVLLEICTASVDDCEAAQSGGANRIELNSALMLGGLTPSHGLIVEARRILTIPLIVMIRPRSGGFSYSQSDLRVMMRDAEFALESGVDGIAFGFLNPDGTLDRPNCDQLIKLARPRQLVFHRAFDVVRDPSSVLEQLIDLGVTRVMTSGQEASAYNGSAAISKLIQQASGRIEILPAGGITRFTIADVLSRTGCNQVHASLTTARKDSSTMARPQVSFGGTLQPPEDLFKVTDSGAVAALRASLDQS